MRFTDRDAYNRYQAAFMEVFQRYSGKLLAADEAPQVVEGQWDGDKVVVMAFPDAAAFRESAKSADYQQISEGRRAGGVARPRTVEDRPGPIGSGGDDDCQLVA